MFPSATERLRSRAAVEECALHYTAGGPHRISLQECQISQGRPCTIQGIFSFETLTFSTLHGTDKHNESIEPKLDAWNGLHAEELTRHVLFDSKKDSLASGSAGRVVLQRRQGVQRTSSRSEIAAVAECAALCLCFCLICPPEFPLWGLSWEDEGCLWRRHGPYGFASPSL